MNLHSGFAVVTVMLTFTLLCIPIPRSATCSTITCSTGVIDQDYLLQHNGGRRVQDTVDRPEERGPGLIVEDDNDAGGG